MAMSQSLIASWYWPASRLVRARSVQGAFQFDGLFEKSGVAALQLVELPGAGRLGDGSVGVRVGAVEQLLPEHLFDAVEDEHGAFQPRALPAVMRLGQCLLEAFDEHQ